MSYEPPTLEGRAMVDLGQQLKAMRARAEHAERERDDARADVDVWKAECAAAQQSRDAACHERDAHAEAANQAEATLAVMIEDRNKANDRIVQLGGELGRAEADNARLMEMLYYSDTGKVIQELEQAVKVISQERFEAIAEMNRTTAKLQQAEAEAARLRAALEEVRAGTQYHMAEDAWQRLNEHVSAALTGIEGTR